MNTIRVGIIGCGVIAPTHVEAFQQQAGVDVVWACDLVEEKAQRLADRYEIGRVTIKASEVFADPAVDVVSICTDHGSHSELVVAALEHGKHVLCEKALAATRAGLDRMFAAHATHPDRLFGAVFQHRFDAAYLVLHALLRQGVFGTLLTAGVQARCLRTPEYYRADAWRGTWAGEGGAVLINQAIHFIDLLDWVTGGICSLCGCHANLTHADTIETEDTAVAALRFRNGALGTLEASCAGHERWEPTVFVTGSEGAVTIRDTLPVKISFADKEREAAIRAEFDAAQQRHDPVIGKDYYGTGHQALIGDFTAAIREGRQPFVTAQSARRAVDLVLGLYASHRSGQWVTIE